ncbi:hypothetical protein GCM10027092_06490 [Yaniella soli]
MVRSARLAVVLVAALQHGRPSLETLVLEVVQALSALKQAALKLAVPKSAAGMAGHPYR